MEKDNLITLLTETLKFYGNQENYDNNQVKLDNGHMARFAIEQTKKLEELSNKMVDDFDDFQKKIDATKTPEDIQKELNDILNGR